MKEINKIMPFRPWHTLNIEDVFRNLNSDEEGLSDEEAGFRLKKFGHNKIIDKNGDKISLILLNQFSNPLIYILVIASAVSLLLMDFLNSAIIAAAVVINAAVGFFQELKASNILKELKKAITYKANVIRGGHSKQIESKDVTVGDILVLRQGDKVPADARLIRQTNFKTNETVLTCESDPVEKSLNVLDEDTAVADRKNMVFMGSF
ncbi:MAG: cation-transporting P-type ATPase, partial [Patescibacteria group bacterium]